MKSFKPFLLIFAVVGLLWACETTDPFVDEVQIHMLTGDYETALQTVEEALEANPDNHTAHFYKGVVIASQGESNEDPRDRKPYYERAKESFDRAKELMLALEERPEEYEELENTIISFWADEYNMGVEIQNDDSLFNATPDPFETSLAHFINAATINPDSAMTYQVLSSTYFQLDDTENAITSYEQAMNLMEQPQVDDYEYLISLYLYENQYEKAIELSERAMAAYEDETIFVQFLADAYIQSGDRERAVSLVEELIANEPDNPQYRRVLGTQVYQNVDQITASVSDLYQEQFDLRGEIRNQSGSELEQTEAALEEIQARIDAKEAEIDELTLIAVREMERVTELEPDSESAHFILGIIYQNRAANLFERRNNTTDNQEAQEYDDRARENLREALIYYERAAEINPDNPENWQSLFQVYTTLGMEEEAEEAMERAGFED
ncbi:MAG: tetratricopeptide repeat protein [Balneolaceae bacterium]|nr:tetratricopeptide repeat protein [Balneolaceae bacterium]